MVKKVLIFIIKFYQMNISGLKPYASCKYVPTCSQYAIEALEKNGIILGILLSIWRILRCNPFSKGGYDPVPVLRRKKRK